MGPALIGWGQHSTFCLFSLPVLLGIVEAAKPCQPPPLPHAVHRWEVQSLWLWSLTHPPKARGTHSFFPLVLGPPPSSLHPLITHKHTILCSFHLPSIPLPQPSYFFSVAPPVLFFPCNPIFHVHRRFPRLGRQARGTVCMSVSTQKQKRASCSGDPPLPVCPRLSTWGAQRPPLGLHPSSLSPSGPMKGKWSYHHSSWAAQGALQQSLTTSSPLSSGPMPSPEVWRT